MKRIIIFFSAAAAAICLAGCSSSDMAETLPMTNGATVAEDITESVTETESETAVSVEDRRKNAAINENQPFMNLYKRNKETGVFDIKHSYSAPWIWYSDIGGFYSFATDEKSFPYDGFKSAFNNWWNSYPDAEVTKIGYEVKVTLKTGDELICTVKKPSDTQSIFTYVELYLYDDVHQPDGAWYSHLLDDQVTDDTLMTSIKVTTGEKIDEVQSIYLTVFTYENDNEFDKETGRYIGGNYTGFEIGKE
ncbi:MAG: hypothetical protein PUB17_01690 [Lachnospiraceae bacterium]|nr:hypothetical protein [Lachnospiraceae bacterium]